MIFMDSMFRPKAQNREFSKPPLKEVGLPGLYLVFYGDGRSRRFSSSDAFHGYIAECRFFGCDVTFTHPKSCVVKMRPDR